jgi:hypothetical protein
MSAAPAGALTAPRLIARISWRVENTVAWLISCSVRIRYQRDLRYQHEPWSRSLRVAECGKYRVNPHGHRPPSTGRPVPVARRSIEARRRQPQPYGSGFSGSGFSALAKTSSNRLISCWDEAIVSWLLRI